MSPFRENDDVPACDRRSSRMAAWAQHAPELALVGAALGVVTRAFGGPMPLAVVLGMLGFCAGAMLPVIARRRLREDPRLCADGDPDQPIAEIKALVVAQVVMGTIAVVMLGVAMLAGLMLAM
jgi:hypothetical protein